MPIVTTEASCLVLAAVTAMVVLRSKTSAACLGRKTTVVQMEGGALRLRAKLGLGPVRAGTGAGEVQVAPETAIIALANSVAAGVETGMGTVTPGGGRTAGAQGVVDTTAMEAQGQGGGATQRVDGPGPVAMVVPVRAGDGTVTMAGRISGLPAETEMVGAISTTVQVGAEAAAGMAEMLEIAANPVFLRVCCLPTVVAGTTATTGLVTGGITGVLDLNPEATRVGGWGIAAPR